MHFLRFGAACLALPLVGCAAQAVAPPQASHKVAQSDDALVKSAMAAAPVAVSHAATIVAFNDKMQPRTLRAGTNGWTCMPDMAHTPGTDPMCLDEAGMGWAQAWMAHKDPPADLT